MECVREGKEIMMGTGGGSETGERVERGRQQGKGKGSH